MLSRFNQSVADGEYVCGVDVLTGFTQGLEALIGMNRPQGASDLRERCANYSSWDWASVGVSAARSARPLAVPSSGTSRNCGRGRGALSINGMQMSSTTPARVLGLDRVGTLRADSDADVVVLSQDLHVLRVMAKGVWQNGESHG
jgi:Amidohydrolase family